ncbi:MAG: tRNA uridine-5-carboxymethylaminomethyl(34) synthesis GTPase MnmE [Ruminococcaceae bacterium]|nr:tRNA uridine-5-carboxymethylaminomethyl(34) synthesis GTPase MnmE [Oscillospiraceae bacterium]
MTDVKGTTIAAIATAPGEGGIAVIRVSGPDAISICDRVFRGKRTLQTSPSHTLSFGQIIHAGRVLDEVLAAVMRGPHSYTGEDVVEISCHGGSFVTRSILSAVLYAGATLADRGEFTKRAFLNGKMDLSQAEAVIDLIQAESDAAVSLSVNQLKGRLSAPIADLRQKILHLAAGLDVMADFPEEDIDETTVTETRQSLYNMIQILSTIIEQGDQGRLIRNGINTVIVGKPNVGKSSLLNYIAGTDRALVSSQAGTTRDVIEEFVRLGDLRLNVFDTAGIRSNAESIEAMGIQKAKDYITKADLILFVVDASRPYDEDDQRIFSLLDQKKTIIILNKSDLESSWKIPLSMQEIPQVVLSAKYKQGIDALEQVTEQLFSLGSITQNRDAAIVNLRQKQAASQARDALKNALKTLESGVPLDLLSVDLRIALEALGTITGESVSDEIINEIFSRFCLGK